ncbi:hypothetical protein QQS21_011226 [Conoideocrella luteorostrata]|uniref:[histone H3]-trimethyl-L-lysine(9) demethylase n=1 Tax=Conoideocrella luteorostrata TaxID=1105319 RepID=A0AAJ0CEK0_9HYPO|nr:hypothetical protein QQS21_011226 [Conoideocrella luteorostrata]
MSTDVVSAPEPVDPGAVPGSRPSSDPSPAAAAVDSTLIPILPQNTINVGDQIECAKLAAPVFLHSPPDSNNATKSEGSDSELSELEDEPTLDDASPAATPTSAPAPVTEPEPASAPAPAPAPSPAPEPVPAPAELAEEEEDIGEVLPDEWSGAVPIFRPTSHQFRDFKKFMKKVDPYGMKSGIIKIIPPKEWKDAQPPLDELVKHIRVREPIKQDIMGSNGTYRQVNILHGRSYNVPQWRQLCEQSEHQPPARRGERRANAEKSRPSRSRPAAPKSINPTTPKKRGRGRPAKNKGKKADQTEERPMTPVSPKPEAEEEKSEDKPMKSIEEEICNEGTKDVEGETPSGRMGGRMGGVKASSKPKTQSVSARRKYSRREGSAMIDEAAFKDFDYRMDISDFTPERCEELERAYWKTLTYAAPLYGADMMGTLFDDRTETWNLNKLPNLLDVLGTKIPGVNTAYLYLGMWKATFAWHLEDVDLYSINYLHFGAPKQWYSISQADARRFEGAMKTVWPADAKACNQFLRHKGFLISPHHLLQHYGIKVNKVVSYPGEFVVTYPYGYHSGYNLGYNCAEAVNFALDTWLEMGKIAKRCECAQAQDSVWINVREIERKLRGEETEYEETDEDDDEDDDDELSGLPTPPASHGVKFKDASRKRRRGMNDKTPRVRVKKIKLRVKSKAIPPCCLCPNDISLYDLLPTDDGRKAHRVCALYLPETYIDSVDDEEVICNVANVHKDRLNLKCLFCRSRRGACFQCSHKKCARGYHATCAAAGGVFVEDQEVPIFDQHGTEYKEQAFEFSCRFHRARRDKNANSETLETEPRIRDAAKQRKVGDMCQIQYLKGDIFAGVVVENREHEETLLVDILPHGDRLEVEWKWLILPDPSDYHLPKASPKALPMPVSRKAKDELKAKRLRDDKPKKDDVFAEGYTWAEYESQEVQNKDQVKVDLAKSDQMWFYLGKASTEARAQYTEDPAEQRHNPKSNYLDSIPKPPKPAPVPRLAYHHQSYIDKAVAYSYNLAANHTAANVAKKPVSFEKPYVYKPKKPTSVEFTKLTTPTTFTKQHSKPYIPPSARPVPAFHNYTQHSSTFSKPRIHLNQQMAANPIRVAHHQPIPQANQFPRQPVSGPVGQQNKPIWQIHSSVYQKYPFFHVNRNRDPSKYRTPYSPHGGFTNGYEGDLRAHLMVNKPNITAQFGAGPIPAGPGSVQQTAPPTAPKTMPAPATKSFKVGLPAAFTLSLQSTKSVTQVPAKAPTKVPARIPVKVPVKVSPVPLPAHVVAAMAKTSQPISNPRPGPSATATTSLKVATTGESQQATGSSKPVQPFHAAPEMSNNSSESGPPLRAANGSDDAQLPRPQIVQEFADVPGSESMQFMDRMIQNLRRASMNGEGN